jgi:hypothetical protein
MVASENNEPNDGWPYDIILPKLVGEPGMSAAELAKAIVQAYVKSYVDIHYTKPVIQSAFDLSQIHTVTGPLEQTVAEPGPLDQLADAMINRLPKLKTKIRDAQLSSSNFHNYTLWDIAHFSRRLVYRSKDKVLRDVVENVQRALTQGAGKFVVAKRCNGADLENCKGVSIYLPLLTDVSDYYAQLDFANQHRWAAMLRAYHR